MKTTGWKFWSSLALTFYVLTFLPVTLYTIYHYGQFAFN
jgi:hypothetical protein